MKSCKSLDKLEKAWTAGVSSQFFREDKPAEWLKPVVAKPRKVKRVRMADTIKFYTSCGKKFDPRPGEKQETWYKARRCDKCMEGPRTSVVQRGGKFCMNCGKFFSVKKLLKMGVDEQKGLSTWASCGCGPKKS